MTARRAHALEIEEDLEFTRRVWRAQRIGWVLLAAWVVAALLGVLGPGPLASSSASSPDGALRLEYGRFEHFQRPFELEFAIGSDATRAELVRIWIDVAYLERFDLERITPEPVATLAGADRQAFEFRALEPGRPMRVTFELEPRSAGRVEGRAGIDGGAELAFTQLVYP